MFEILIFVFLGFLAGFAFACQWVKWHLKQVDKEFERVKNLLKRNGE